MIDRKYVVQLARERRQLTSSTLMDFGSSPWRMLSRSERPGFVGGSNPSPFGEGWGEGTAMERNPPFPFLSERIREEKEEIFSLLLHLRPHPTLSQRER